MAKLNSFHEGALQLLEEAHRALSRLEAAVATAAAPELIVVAVEVRVACNRGMHLFRTYGRYRYFGKLVAAAKRGSVIAKFAAVTAQFKGIMPHSGFLSGNCTGLGIAAGSPIPGVPLHMAHMGSAGLSNSGCSTPCSMAQNGNMGIDLPGFDHVATGHGDCGIVGTVPNDATIAAAATGVLANRLKGGASSTPQQLQCLAVNTGSAAQPMPTLIRSGAHDKITAVTFAAPPDNVSAAAAVWWAVGDHLEFYSEATQSTTSFAASAAVQAEKAAIMAITLDSAGNVWAGTAKGSVLTWRRRNWEHVFVERAFTSCVRCLAADADSDVVWAGDETGRLGVFRCVDGNNRLECTASIITGRPNSSKNGLKGRSTTALDVKPRVLALRRTVSCRSGFEQSAEGPIRALLVRDDRAWVAGGRTEPWIGLFDAVAGWGLR
eukprot:GHRR01025695.1.p1 GENE.GHRR01025695.1~~GHRR01025695.1.p1  ORF type:complete len:435 (+),score=161.29 GHRR01025695.1:1143-2447(+)